MEDLKLLKPEEITQKQYILFTEENYHILRKYFSYGGWDFNNYVERNSGAIEGRRVSLYIDSYGEVHATSARPIYDIFKGFTKSEYNPDKGWEFS